MPRYWTCKRCGAYNLENICEACGIGKEEADALNDTSFNEIDDDELEEEMDDWLFTEEDMEEDMGDDDP